MVDRDRVAALMETFCTRSEVAAVLGMSVTDLVREVPRAFSDEFGREPTYDEVEERHYAHGRALVRRAQFDAALDGDRSMLLALGKEYLGQNGRAEEAKEPSKEGTLLALVQGKYADAADRKSVATH